MDDKVPYIEEGLLRYLDKLFPDTSPEPSQTDREIWINRGAAGVVRHLRHVYKMQHENMLGDTEDVLFKP